MASCNERKSAYEREREANIRRNMDLLKKLGLNLEENRPIYQQQNDESSQSGNESDNEWNPNDGEGFGTTHERTSLKQMPIAVGLTDSEKRKTQKRKIDSSKNESNPKRKIDKSKVTKNYTFGKAQKMKIQNSNRNKETDCFEDLKYINFSSDEEVSKTEDKISYEDYLQRREDAMLMEEEIAQVSRYIRQQKLDDNLEIQDSNDPGILLLERGRRHLKHIDYTEEELTTEDSFIYCEECDDLHQGDCPLYGELEPLDESVMQTNSLSIIPIPRQLSVKMSAIPKAGLGVFSKVTIPIRTRMGPYMGTLVKGSCDDFPNDSEYLWQIKRDAGRTVWFVDGADLNRANWLRYVNCARNEEEQNLVAFQFRGRIYYRSYKVINPGDELLVYYGDSYAKQLGIEENGTKDAVIQVPHGGGSAVKGDSVVRRDFSRTRKDKPFKCELCPSSFQHKTNLTTHNRLHTGEKLFECSDCKKKFTGSLNLTIHLRTHTGEKPFECPTCKKKFNHSSSLTTHLRTHTGEKPFECPTCKKKFNHSSSLTTHLRTHTGEKPFECPTCEKKFNQSSHLTIHLRTHTGEKPFECRVCNKMFSDSSDRNKHEKRHIN